MSNERVVEMANHLRNFLRRELGNPHDALDCAALVAASFAMDQMAGDPAAAAQLLEQVAMDNAKAVRNRLIKLVETTEPTLQ